jgi:hypothetical protein
MMEGEEDSEIVSIRESKTINDSRLGILKSDGSLWVAYNYNLPPAKKIDGVLYADGGHAVKTDGSIWDIHREIMVLPPGTALTER